MRKKALVLGTFLFICGFLQEILAQTEEETMTITTYYPAPYGVYNEMRAKRMAVGTNYYNGSAYPWDTGGGCVGNEICNADLVVQGKVGIGTTSPNSPLHVIGTVNAEAFQAFETNGAYAFMERGIDNDGIVQFGGFNVATTSFTDTRIDGVPLVLQSRSGGNVGIGTASPINRLDVRSAPSQNILSAVETTSNKGVWIGHDGTQGIIRTTFDATGGFSPLTFQTSNADRIYITTTGNVGIGTASPGAKLAVAGEINAGSAADKTVFHKGNLILITCGFSWTPHPGGWAERIWTSGDCGGVAKLPSQYANSMRAISGSDWNGDRLIYCNSDTLRVFQPASYNAYARCDYLCWIKINRDSDHFLISKNPGMLLK